MDGDMAGSKASEHVILDASAMWLGNTAEPAGKRTNDICIMQRSASVQEPTADACGKGLEGKKAEISDPRDPKDTLGNTVYTGQHNIDWNCSALHTLQLLAKVEPLLLGVLRGPWEGIAFPPANF